MKSLINFLPSLGCFSSPKSSERKGREMRESDDRTGDGNEGTDELNERRTVRSSLHHGRRSLHSVLWSLTRYTPPLGYASARCAA